MKTNPIKQLGFSIIELMIAIAIGLIITLVVTEAYLSGITTQQAQAGLSRAQESSRFAFDVLARALRKAGYKNPKAPGTAFCSTPNENRIVALNDQAKIDPSATDMSGTSVVISNSSDVIRVRYYGEGLSYSPYTADGTIFDCLGNSVKPNALVEDTFFISADTNNNNEPTLFCYSTNSTASGNVALVPGIESLQLLYGEDTDSDGSINRYVPYSLVSTANNVRSVIISVIAKTNTKSAVEKTTAQTFYHFGSTYPASDNSDTGSSFTPALDGKVRQHFSTTIALRNLCPV